ncbi:MAG: anthranilate phosphoribosyltransferase [Candidatus Omnitrophica bacterium]|nr:anthranilate phosphoribosyltransferase [Candidatus Omnitrophota bacterium]
MAIIFHPTDSPIVRGIKTVGVGKKGSQPLARDLAVEILADLKAGLVPAAAIGAFFAGLSFKGIEDDEKILGEYFPSQEILSNPVLLARQLCQEAPPNIRKICEQIMAGQTLDQETALILGRFLFSDQPGDTARGLIACALRVRYETDDEYAGLLKAMQETIAAPWRIAPGEGAPLIQLAEPFDGNDKSFLITPVLGDFLIKQGYRVLHMVGRNSGPKFDMNLLDVANGLDIEFLSPSMDLKKRPFAFGWFLRQQDLSQPIDRWVEIRRQTVKRPFLATLEKFLNPWNASVIAVSAFHPPYGEKMLTVAERAGFPGIIVVRNGIEGSLAFSLKRETRLLCSVRKNDGSYLRHEIVFQPDLYLSHPLETEEKNEHPKAIDNARLIKEYIAAGKTANRHFDSRIQLTCEGFRQALQWIKTQQSE